MEYEQDRLNLGEITRTVGIERLMQGHEYTPAFFTEIQKEPGSTELPPDREWLDTPPPIVYDDEFGKAVVSFVRIKTGSTTMPVFSMTYQEEGRQPVHLNNYINPHFYFARTNKGFSTLSVLGDPVVFFNYELLTSSRKFLLALGHEMGHTMQGQIELDLWEILRLSTIPIEKTVSTVRKQYPYLREYVNDLSFILQVAREEDSSKRQQLAKQVRNIGANGLDMRWLDKDLPQRVEEVLQTVTNAPIGPSHPAGFFNSVRINIPAAYDVFDPMEERLGWQYAMNLDTSLSGNGIMYCGFHNEKERVLFMKRNLETYDRKYKVNNYTRWLDAI